MSRQTLKDLAQEPLAALSAMAGAALLALTVTASDGPAPGKAAAVRQAAGPAAVDLRTGPIPRLRGLDLPWLEGLARDAADCALAEERDAVGGRLLYLRVRGV